MQSVFLKAQTNTTRKLSQKVASKWTFILLCRKVLLESELFGSRQNPQGDGGWLVSNLFQGCYPFWLGCDVVQFYQNITCQANVKAVTSVHCPQCKMVTALIGNGQHFT